MSAARVTGVVWKDEGDFGFITLVYDHERPGPVPFDPDRERPYGSREDALALAREHGVELQEV